MGEGGRQCDGIVVVVVVVEATQRHATLHRGRDEPTRNIKLQARARGLGMREKERG